MDAQMVFNAILAISAFLGGWVLNSITKSLDRLDSDVRELPKIYVTREDYRRDIAELKDLCRQIFDRLDSKADKPHR